MGAVRCRTCVRWINDPQFPIKRVLLIYFVIMSDALALGLPAPFLPQMARSFGYAEEYVGVVVGMMTGMYLVCNFLSSFLFGHLSDRYGRKPMFLMGLFSGFVCTLSFPFSNNAFVAVLNRCVAGFFNANQAVVRASLSDIVHPARRLSAFAYLGSVYALARAVSSSASGILTGIEVLGNPFVLPCLLGGVFQGASFVAVIFFFQETLDKTSEASMPVAAVAAAETPGCAAKMMQGLKIVNNDRIIKLLVALYALNSFANGGYLIAIVLYMTLPTDRHGLGFAALETGIAFALFGLFGFFFQLALNKRVTTNLGALKTYKLGAFVLVAATSLFPWVSVGSLFPTVLSDQANTVLTWCLLVPALFLAIGGFMFGIPMGQALLSNAQHPRIKGLTQGVAQSSASLLRGLSPIVVGGLFSVTQERGAPYAVFLLLDVVFVACLCILFVLPSSVDQPRELLLAEELVSTNVAAQPLQLELRTDDDASVAIVESGVVLQQQQQQQQQQEEEEEEQELESNDVEHETLLIR